MGGLIHTVSRVLLAGTPPCVRADVVMLCTVDGDETMELAAGMALHRCVTLCVFLARRYLVHTKVHIYISLISSVDIRDYLCARSRAVRTDYHLLGYIA